MLLNSLTLKALLHGEKKKTIRPNTANEVYSLVDTVMHEEIKKTGKLAARLRKLRAESRSNARSKTYDNLQHSVHISIADIGRFYGLQKGYTVHLDKNHKSIRSQLNFIRKKLMDSYSQVMKGADAFTAAEALLILSYSSLNEYKDYISFDFASWNKNSTSLRDIFEIWLTFILQKIRLQLIMRLIEERSASLHLSLKHTNIDASTDNEKYSLDSSLQSGLPPLKLSSTSRIKDKHRLIKLGGFDEHLGRQTPRCLRGGENYFTVSELREELEIAQQGLMQLDSRVNGDIAWVQFNCDATAVGGKISFQATQKCQLIAATKLVEIIKKHIDSIMIRCLLRWNSVCKHQKFNQMALAFSKAKSIDILARTLSVAVKREYVRGWQPWRTAYIESIRMQRMAAAVQIQRVIRGRLGRLKAIRLVKIHSEEVRRKIVELMHEATRAQKEFEAKQFKLAKLLEEERNAHINANARIIQLYYQGKLAIKRARMELRQRREENAATIVQKSGRGYKARKLMAELVKQRETDRKRVMAEFIAQFISSMVNSLLLKLSSSVHRKDSHPHETALRGVISLQSLFRRKQAMDEVRDERERVARLKVKQKEMKGSITVMINPYHQTSILKIQCLMRGKLARNARRRLKEQENGIGDRLRGVIRKKPEGGLVATLRGKANQLTKSNSASAADKKLKYNKQPSGQTDTHVKTTSAVLKETPRVSANNDGRSSAKSVASSTIILAKQTVQKESQHSVVSSNAPPSSSFIDEINTGAIINSKRNNSSDENSYHSVKNHRFVLKHRQPSRIAIRTKGNVTTKVEKSSLGSDPWSLTDKNVSSDNTQSQVDQPPHSTLSLIAEEQSTVLAIDSDHHVDHGSSKTLNFESDSTNERKEEPAYDHSEHHHIAARKIQRILRRYQSQITSPPIVESSKTSIQSQPLTEYDSISKKHSKGKVNKRPSAPKKRKTKRSSFVAPFKIIEVLASSSGGISEEQTLVLQSQTDSHTLEEVTDATVDDVRIDGGEQSESSTIIEDKGATNILICEDEEHVLTEKYIRMPSESPEVNTEVASTINYLEEFHYQEGKADNKTETSLEIEAEITECKNDTDDGQDLVDAEQFNGDGAVAADKKKRVVRKKTKQRVIAKNRKASRADSVDSSESVYFEEINIEPIPTNDIVSRLSAMETASIKIQCFIRGSLARKKVKATKALLQTRPSNNLNGIRPRKPLKHFLAQKEASIKIQSMTRGMSVRSRLKLRRDSVIDEEEAKKVAEKSITAQAEKIEKGIVAVQSLYRRKKAIEVVNEKRISTSSLITKIETTAPASMIPDKSAEDSAVKIQSIYRKRVAITIVKEKRENLNRIGLRNGLPNRPTSSPGPSRLPPPLVNRPRSANDEKAIKIQSLYRRRIAKKQLQNKIDDTEYRLKIKTYVNCAASVLIEEVVSCAINTIVQIFSKDSEKSEKSDEPSAVIDENDTVLTERINDEAVPHKVFQLKIGTAVDASFRCDSMINIFEDCLHTEESFDREFNAQKSSRDDGDAIGSKGEAPLLLITIPSQNLNSSGQAVPSANKKCTHSELEASIILQSFARQIIAKSRAAVQRRKLISVQEKIGTIIEFAAVTIQRYVRGRLARNRIKTFTKTRIMENQQKLNIEERIKHLEEMEACLIDRENRMLEATKIANEKVDALTKALQLLEERARQDEADRMARKLMAAESQGSVAAENQPESLLVNGIKWFRLWDDQSSSWYWYCETTGISQWGDPSGEDGYESAGALTDYSTDFGSEVADKEGVNMAEDEWQEYWDEAAQSKYWYNNNTGEATWTKPEVIMSSVPSQVEFDSDNWISCIDETIGQEYWYNTKTGETSWV